MDVNPYQPWLAFTVSNKISPKYSIEILVGTISIYYATSFAAVGVIFK